MFKNDKIFVFLVVLFSVLILFTTNVFASTETVDITFPDDTGVVLNQAYFDNVFKEIQAEYPSHDLKSYFVDFYNTAPNSDTGRLGYRIIVYNSIDKFSVNNDGFIPPESASFFAYRTCYYKSTNLNYPASTITIDGLENFNVALSTWEHYTFLGNIDSSSYTFTNNYRILDSSGSVLSKLFLVPLQGNLALIMKETPLEGVLQEIVGILPIVLMIIVGLIGLRKALSLLSKVLHRS